MHFSGGRRTDKFLSRKESVMADMIELAIAYWRLSKWIDECDSSRKLPAQSSLRIISEFLCSQGISITDMTGTKYDPGFCIEIIHIEKPDLRTDTPLITEMLCPIIMKNGTVVRTGQAVLSNSYLQKKARSRTRKSEKASEKKTTKSSLTKR